MKPEEVFRLSNFSREEFLEILTQHQQQYSYLARVLLEHLISHNKSIKRYRTIEEFQSTGEMLLQKLTRELILDLDLDYFNDSNYFNSNPNLKDETQIIDNLKYLRDIAKWDVVTVALSPEFCGGIEPCEYLFNLFLNIFEIDTKDLIDIY